MVDLINHHWRISMEVGSSLCVPIPAAAVNETFIRNLSRLVRRLSAAEPARRVPSARECGYCDISSVDCPERVVEDAVAEGVTEDF